MNWNTFQTYIIYRTNEMTNSRSMIFLIWQKRWIKDKEQRWHSVYWNIRHTPGPYQSLLWWYSYCSMTMSRLVITQYRYSMPYRNKGFSHARGQQKGLYISVLLVMTWLFPVFYVILPWKVNYLWRRKGKLNLENIMRDDPT